MATRLSQGRPATPAVVFGRAVARERTRQGLTMAGLADVAGTHESEVSRLERGLRDPKLSTMTKLAKGLDVPLSRLVDDG